MAGLAFASALLGDPLLAVRLLLLAYVFDALDGCVARRTGGGSREGLMLDRAFDRFSQVVAPLAVYATVFRGSLRGVEALVFAVYTALLVTTAFYRLVRRVVWSLEYFAGLPLFVHALVLLASVIAESPVPGPVLLALALASLAPVPYMRRLGRGSTPSPGVAPRLLLLLLLALVPYGAEPVRLAARLLQALAMVYAALGPLPPLLRRGARRVGYVNK